MSISYNEMFEELIVSKRIKPEICDICSLTPHNDSCYNLKYECHEAVISQKERYNTYVMI